MSEKPKPVAPERPPPAPERPKPDHTESIGKSYEPPREKRG
jgi:hypothetical protein